MRNGKYTKLKTAVLLVIISLMAIMTGCTTYESFKNTFIENNSEDAAEPVIMIGVFEPLSGSDAQKGKDEVKGIELANSIYSNVNGYKVVLTKVDTQSKVSAAETSVQGLIEMKPVAIIGSAGEAASLAASTYVNDAGIPAITPSATNPLITQNNGYYFRACITEYQMGDGLGEYACGEKGSRRLGIVSLKNDSSTAALIDGLDDRIKKIAGRKKDAVAYQTEIAGTDEELDDVIKKLKSRDVDICFIGFGTELSDAFFTKVENAGLTDITFLGTRSWGNSDFISMMDKHKDIKVVFPYESVLTRTDNTSDALTEEAQKFQIQYSARYGADDIPSDNAALGYDSYLILINAIHNAKSTDGADIRRALKDLKELKCCTGVFSFDERGNVVRSVNLSTIKDGKAVSEYVTGTEAEAKALEELDDSSEEDTSEEDVSEEKTNKENSSEDNSKVNE